MSFANDLLMAVSMLLGLSALVWLGSELLQNRGRRDYRPSAVAGSLISGLAMLDLPLALVYFKARSPLLFPPCFLACVAVFIWSAKRIGKMKGDGKWKNDKIKLTLK